MEQNIVLVRAADERLDALLGHRGAATVSLLFALSDGAKRFGVLRSQMGRMSQKTLVAELRALEQLGAVERIGDPAARGIFADRGRRGAGPAAARGGDMVCEAHGKGGVTWQYAPSRRSGRRSLSCSTSARSTKSP